MILVDTSVWINYFNNTAADKYTDLLDASLVEGIVAIGDLIFLEILQGFRNDRDYKKAKNTLRTLPQYELFGNDMVFTCADNYRSLRKQGITIRRTTDVIIATFCIEHRMPLLFFDRDFIPFVDKFGLIPVLGET